MDHSGNNRYELLFMDDDISDPLDNIVAKNKKQVKTAAAVGGGVGGGVPSKTTKQQNVDGSTNKTQSNKKPNQAEKENKPLTMNKNDSNKKPTGGAVNATDKFNKQQGGAAINANRKRNGPNGGGTAAVNETAGGQGQGIRNVNFRQQNGETREQRNNRRNARENGYNNNTASAAAAAAGGVGGGEVMSPQQRQLRDRDNRGPPRNRNFENRGGKREFDRQSGSDKTAFAGVKAIDKRDGAGAHNWGSVKETIDDVNKNGVVEGKEINVEKAEESGNEQAEQTHVEEEAKELTLDEWKAQKQQRAKPTFNIRKAGEGEDTSQWKKMIVLTNNKKKENESEDELEFDPAMYPQRVGRQQRVLDIQFNFNDGRRGGGGFGGRGRGGRGPRPVGAGSVAAPNPGGERPAPRGGFEGSRGPGGNLGRGKRNYGNHQNAAPKVNDERQFPTLA